MGTGTVTAAELGSRRDLHPATALVCQSSTQSHSRLQGQGCWARGLLQGVPLAQDLCLLLAQEPVPHLDVPGADFLHPGHGRSPAPASFPNCLRSKKLLRSTGWSIPTSKGTVREQLFPRPVPVPRPCRCMAQSQHKTSCGRPPPAPGELSEGVLTVWGWPQGMQTARYPPPQILLPPGHSQGWQGSSKPAEGIGHLCHCPDQAGAGQVQPSARTPRAALQEQEGKELPPALSDSQVTHCNNRNR